MHLTHVSCPSAPFSFLYFGAWTPGATTLEDAPSLFSLLLFFFLINLATDDAINGDRVKLNTSRQLLCHAKERRCVKIEFEIMQCRERYGREKYLNANVETYKLKLKTYN
jgi:hypothetical protein